MRRLMLPLIALLLAGTATFAARSYLEGRGQPEAAAEAPPAPRKAILVAAQDLAAGSFIQPGSLRWQEWPDVATPETYLLRGEKDEQELVGAVVRRPLAVGEPVVDGNSSNRAIAASLPPCSIPGCGRSPSPLTRRRATRA